MSPRARRCAGCGGPLPDGDPHAPAVTCSFCGMVNDLAAAKGPTIVKLDVRDAAVHLGRYVKLAIGLGVAVVALGVAIVVWRALQPITDALTEVREQADAVREATRPLALTELATFPDGGWRQVDAPPPAGGWTAFDPVAGVEWALRIAQAWAPDARLARIDVARVSADGTTNLAGELEDGVGYRFVSPARVADWERIADREVNARVPYELMLQVAREQVTATVRSGRPPARAVPPPCDSLPLRDLLARARASARFAEHPFYAGFLIHVDREGWAWRFQSLSGRASLPRVRARDAAVYPYR